MVFIAPQSLCIEFSKNVYILRRNKNDDVTKTGRTRHVRETAQAIKNRANDDVATTAEKVPLFK